MESIRVQRFKGCTGSVSIDADSNGRRDLTFFLGYTLMDVAIQNFTFYLVGTYSAVENPAMKINGEFVYAGRETSSPNDMRVIKWECPF